MAVPEDERPPAIARLAMIFLTAVIVLTTVVAVVVVMIMVFRRL